MLEVLFGTDVVGRHVWEIVGGFSVREIARAFFEEEASTAQRIVRAKRHMREHGLTLDMPSGHELAERLVRDHTLRLAEYVEKHVDLD